MLISLDEDQVALLAAVDAGLVHTDPRFTRPDFERVPGQPGHRRATQRLQPLKDWRLVELDPAAAPTQFGVQPYRLTDRGQGVLAHAHEQQATAGDGSAPRPPTSPDAAGAGITTSTGE